MTFCIMSLTIMIHCIKKPNKATIRMPTLSTMTFRITTLMITIKSNTQYKKYSDRHHVAIMHSANWLKSVMLSVIMQSVIVLNVVMISAAMKCLFTKFKNEIKYRLYNIIILYNAIETSGQIY